LHTVFVQPVVSPARIDTRIRIRYESGMAGRRFVDAHVHFWDHSVPGLRWAFLEPTWEHPKLGAMKTLDAPRYTTDEFRASVGDVNVDKVVHVEATARDCDPVAETAWLHSVAEETGWPTAIVGRCALGEPDAPAVIQRHAEHDRFRGVRDLKAGSLLRTAAVDDACRALAEVGASCELFLTVDQFDAARSLAERHDTVTFVLGHMGLPVARDDDHLPSWQAALESLRSADNVVCKISALSGADPNWTIDSIRPWFSVCLDVFGIDRCILASNWPVDSLFGDYPGLSSVHQGLTAHLAESEQAALLATNAERVYRI
jgi:predicted TIM-barrel fold metal-dependent hydrolase